MQEIEGDALSTGFRTCACLFLFSITCHFVLSPTPLPAAIPCKLCFLCLQVFSDLLKGKGVQGQSGEEVWSPEKRRHREEQPEWRMLRQ